MLPLFCTNMTLHGQLGCVRVFYFPPLNWQTELHTDLKSWLEVDDTKSVEIAVSITRESVLHPIRTLCSWLLPLWRSTDRCIHVQNDLLKRRGQIWRGVPHEPFKGTRWVQVRCWTGGREAWVCRRNAQKLFLLFHSLVTQDVLAPALVTVWPFCSGTLHLKLRLAPLSLWDCETGM